MEETQINIIKLDPFNEPTVHVFRLLTQGAQNLCALNWRPLCLRVEDGHMKV